MTFLFKKKETFFNKNIGEISGGQQTKQNKSTKRSHGKFPKKNLLSRLLRWRVFSGAGVCLMAKSLNLDGAFDGFLVWKIRCLGEPMFWNIFFAGRKISPEKNDQTARKEQNFYPENGW